MTKNHTDKEANLIPKYPKVGESLVTEARGSSIHENIEAIWTMHKTYDHAQKHVEEKARTCKLWWLEQTNNKNTHE